MILDALNTWNSIKWTIRMKELFATERKKQSGSEKKRRWNKVSINELNHVPNTFLFVIHHNHRCDMQFYSKKKLIWSIENEVLCWHGFHCICLNKQPFIRIWSFFGWLLYMEFLHFPFLSTIEIFLTLWTLEMKWCARSMYANQLTNLQPTQWTFNKFCKII